MNRTANLLHHPVLAAEHDRAVAPVRYGALPWRRMKSGVLKVMLITSPREGVWSLPSSLPVDGKTPAEAAAREALAEAGVIGEIDTGPVGRYDHAEPGAGGSKTLCTVEVFGLRVRGTLTHWPQRGRRERRWFTLDEAGAAVAESDFARLLMEAGADQRPFQ